MIRVTNYLAFLGLVFTANAGAELVLQKGSNCRDCLAFNNSEKNKVWDLEDVADNKNVFSIKSIVAYASVDGGVSYYVLDRSMFLAQISVSNQSVVGPWSLTRWPYQSYSSNLQDTFGILGESYPTSDIYLGVGLSLGCLGDAPLRYGDIDSDGKNELVVFNGMFTLFSPQYKRTVFAAYLTESDWVTEEDAARIFNEGVPGVHQYASRFLSDNNSVGAAGAIRSYSKLYVGNYDGDSHPDILVWRKEYRSNLKADVTPGFTKIADTVFHYERDLAAQQASKTGVTGDYLPQRTPEETIIGWLSSNNLTWSAGYPSQSECSGQEEQLIPEIHDPLLNDPDVLEAIPTPDPTPTP